MATTTMSTVVIYPGTVLCPACSQVLHRADHHLSGKPTPERIMVRCLNGKCLEKGINKWLPLQHLDVEVYHADPVPEPD